MMNSIKNARRKSLLALRKSLVVFVTLAAISTCSGNPVDGCQHAPASPKTKICTTKQCKETASWILNNMDCSVDPCDNFYQFVCGNFMKDTKVPENKGYVKADQSAIDNFKSDLREAIEKESTPDELHSTRLVKNWYRNCMDEELINKDGISELKEILMKFGGWPVLLGNDWVPDKFTWQETVYKSIELGYENDSFISLKYFPKEQKSGNIIISEGSSAVADLNGANKSYALEVAVLLGANEDQAKEELKKAYEFEQNLARLNRWSKDGFYFGSLDSSNIHKMNELYPSIQWGSYLRKVLPTLPITDTTEFYISEKSPYISELEKLLNSTDKRVQANYAIWKVVERSLGYLTKEFRDKKYFVPDQFGEDDEKPTRSDVCLNSLLKNLQIPTLALYARNYVPESAKETATEILTNIRRELADKLKSLSWMDKGTADEALKKAESIRYHVAYPDDLLNTKIENDYETLEINRGTYLQSYLNLTVFRRNIYNKKLKENTALEKDIFQWLSSPLSDWIWGNDMDLYIPPKSLGGVSFNKERPKYMNYGGIGTKIGQAITCVVSGMCNLGTSPYGQKWWNPTSVQQFSKKAKCITDEYEKYIKAEFGIQVNGSVSQYGTISAFMGYTLAYLANNKVTGKNEPQLPGLNYTPEQMFWIAAASQQCIKYIPEVEHNYYDIMYNGGIPGNFTVTTLMSNIPEFSRDFKCPKTSRMYRPKNCDLA